MKYFCKSDNILELLAQRIWRECGVYISGDVDTPTGHRCKPTKSTLADPASRKDVGLGDLQRCLPTSEIL